MMTPQRLFVVAAHPDDDVIGAGGLIARVARAGGRVDVAYLSDGGRSHPGSRAFPAARVATLREAEARAALRILGVREEPTFARLPDGGLAGLAPARRAATVAWLAAAIAARGPDVLAMPWRRDPHPDHVAASAIATDAARRSGVPVAIVAYEVWLRIHGAPSDLPRKGEAMLREIPLDDDETSAKRAAIRAHRTQTTALIDDDPSGFRIDDALLARWTEPLERFYVDP